MKTGTAEENQGKEFWVNHMHPLHAKVAKGITGLQLQTGRIIFPLDDGRLGELHQSGLGGESLGPSPQVNIRRKTSVKYVWSILDVPETEGWNAEYCTEEQGSSNCIIGMKDDLNDAESTRSRRRKGSKVQEFYLTPAASIGSSEKTTEEYPTPQNWVDANFRLRVMHRGTSFFLVTDVGLTFEYLNTDKAWFWLRHEHSTAMKGALGNYNGSMFLVDEHKNLLIRERSSKELVWINCSAMKKGKQVTGGPPWDFDPAKARKVTSEDALFFVSKSGRLLQFTVSCLHPIAI